MQTSMPQTCLRGSFGNNAAILKRTWDLQQGPISDHCSCLNFRVPGLGSEECGTPQSVAPEQELRATSPRVGRCFGVSRRVFKSLETCRGVAWALTDDANEKNVVKELGPKIQTSKRHTLNSQS